MRKCLMGTASDDDEWRLRINLFPRLYLILIGWKVYIHLCFVHMKKLISSHRAVNGISNPDLYESAECEAEMTFPYSTMRLRITDSVPHIMHHRLSAHQVSERFNIKVSM